MRRLARLLRVLRHAYGSRDARRMIAYLDVRLAGINQPVAMAAE